MAYILKSNVSVNDPDNRFEYYSDYGKTNKEVARFLSNMSATGYMVTKPEFTALNNFVENLKEAAIWDKVYEVYPLMGKDTAGTLVKLKAYEGGEIMTVMNGFNDSMLEIVNGKVLGKKVTSATSQGNQPMVNTGLSIGKIFPNAGFHFYFGESQPLAASYWQPVVGALLTSSAGGIAAQIAVNMAINEDDRVLGSSKIIAPINNSMALRGFNAIERVAGVSNQVKRYDGTTKTAFSQGSLASVGDSGATKIAIFGRNAPHTANGAGTSTSYSGKVRFGCVTSGYLDDNQMTTLYAEITTLLTALGKLA